MTMHNIFIAGGVSYDTLVYVHQLPEPRPHNVYAKGQHQTVGSTGAGKGLNLAKLGFDVTLHSLLGEDAAGEAARQGLEQPGLRLLTDPDPAGTEQHLNLMAENGDRLSIYTVTASFEPEIDLTRLEPLIAAADLVVLNIINYCRWLIPLAQEYGKPIWSDLHDYNGRSTYHQDFIDAADVLTLSSDNLPDDQFKPVMERLISSGKELVVCTHGVRGATAVTRDGQWLTLPSLTSYPLVDANGAGDAFFSGLLYGIAHRLPLEEALHAARTCAALCISQQELAHPDLTPDRLRAAMDAAHG